MSSLLTVNADESATLRPITHPHSPKFQGSSDLRPHVSQTQPETLQLTPKAGAPRALLFLRSTKENSKCQRGSQGQSKGRPTNHPEIPGMKWRLGGGGEGHPAHLRQIPGLSRASREERQGRYQTPRAGPPSSTGSSQFSLNSS